MRGFVGSMEKAALKNKTFRTVLYTAKNCQLVVMSLKPAARGFRRSSSSLGSKTEPPGAILTKQSRRSPSSRPGRHLASFPPTMAKPPQQGSGCFLPGGRPPVNVLCTGGRSPNGRVRLPDTHSQKVLEYPGDG